MNNHFYWYRHYSSPPPPPYYAAISAARVTIQAPMPFIHPYYTNPRPYGTVQPPPHLLHNHRIPPLTTTATAEPDPCAGQGIVGRMNGSGGRCRGRGRSRRVNTSRHGFRRKVRRESRATATVESDDREITTVMIRNIPNKYTRELMIEFLDKHCQDTNEKEREELQECGSDEVKEELVLSAYDFLYLPIDFKSGMNKGYAFVNFTEAASVVKFVKECNHKAWDIFNSKKRLQVASARIQGKEELVRHFEGMPYSLEEYAAVRFTQPRIGPSDDGSSASHILWSGDALDVPLKR